MGPLHTSFSRSLYMSLASPLASNIQGRGRTWIIGFAALTGRPFGLTGARRPSLKAEGRAVAGESAGTVYKKEMEKEGKGEGRGNIRIKLLVLADREGRERER